MQTTTINSEEKKEAKDVWRVQSNKIALKQIVNKFIQIIMVVYFSSVHIITRPLLEIRIDFHLFDASDVSPDSDHHKQLHYYIYLSIICTDISLVSAGMRPHHEQTGDEEVYANESTYRYDMNAKHDSFFVLFSNGRLSDSVHLHLLLSQR